MAGRTQDKIGTDAPGPGAYSLQDSSISGPAFSLSSRSPTKLSSDSPGPGAYEKPSSLGHAPAFSVSLSFFIYYNFSSSFNSLLISL